MLNGSDIGSPRLAHNAEARLSSSGSGSASGSFGGGGSLNSRPTITVEPVENAFFMSGGGLDESTEEMYYSTFSDVQKQELMRHYKLGRPLGQRVYDILCGRAHPQDAKLAATVSMFTIVLVIASCCTFIIESYPSFYARRNDAGKYTSALFVIESVCVAFFSLEIGLRIVTAPKLAQLKSFDFAVDVLSVLGYFIDLAVDLGRGESTQASAIVVLRVFRLIRVFRIFKLSRYSKGLQLVTVVFRSSMNGLAILIVPILLAIVFFATAIYFLEVSTNEEVSWNPTRRRWIHNDGTAIDIQSIPDAMWFVVVTVTTVGYGDVEPLTVGGRIVSSFAMFFGVLTLSFPNIVIGANFALAYRKSKMFRARVVLGAKLRRVFYLSTFIGRARQLAKERKMRAMTPRTGGRDQSAKKLNYMFTHADFDALQDPDIPVITTLNIRTWQYQNVTAISVLQSLLCACSGVGTAKEIAAGLSTETHTTRERSVNTILAHLFHDKFINIFVVRRYSLMLVCLLPEAVTELAVHNEPEGITCIRSIDVARYMWKQTTGQSLSVNLRQLGQVYENWNTQEGAAANASDSSVVDLKTQSMSLDGQKPSFRLAGSKLERAAALDEAKRIAKDKIAQQQMDILELQSKLDAENLSLSSSMAK